MQLPISPLFLLPYTAVSRISFACRRVVMVKSTSKYDLMMIAETFMGYKNGANFHKTRYSGKTSAVPRRVAICRKRKVICVVEGKAP